MLLVLSFWFFPLVYQYDILCAKPEGLFLNLLVSGANNFLQIEKPEGGTVPTPDPIKRYKEEEKEKAHSNLGLLEWF